MSFHTIFFIFLFLPILFLLYCLSPKKLKNPLLVIASFLFYAWNEPIYILLFIFLIIMNYGLGLYIQKHREQSSRCLVEAIALNLFIFIYFKYYDFILTTIFSLLHIQIDYQTFPMPTGISFFMFTILSYLFDIYYQKIDAETNLLHLTLYISFFPKLVMGPIMRYQDMKKQMDNHPVSPSSLEQGTKHFMVGLAQKVILANTFASLWQNTPTTNLSMSYAWIAIIAYTLQIYFDFQGYTQMAIGIGKWFGFTLPDNFHYPYIATSITDFWRRWHITLSSWFRDYVYIPLGGNRTTLAKHIRNILIVWLLTGIWHGASWNFIFWGFYFGVLLILEKYVIGQFIQKLPKILQHFITMLIIMIGWVFFVHNDIHSIIFYLSAMFHLNGNAIIDRYSLFLIQNYGLYFIVGILWCTPFLKKLFKHLEHYFQEQLWFMKPILTILFWVILMTYMISDTYQTFLYFQF